MQLQLQPINAYGQRENLLCFVHDNMTVTLRNFNALICVMWFFARPLSLVLTHLSALGSIFAAADPVFPHLLPNSKPCVKWISFHLYLLANLIFKRGLSEHHCLKTATFVHKQEVASCFVPSNWVAVCGQFYISSFVFRQGASGRRHCNTLPWWSGTYWYGSAPTVRWPHWPYLIKLSMTYQPRKKKSMLPATDEEGTKNKNKWKRGCVLTV